MSDVDEIEQAAALAEAQTGARGAAALRLCRTEDEKAGSRRWTAAEDAYLREHLGRVPETAIAEALGRTLQSVHLRWTRELHLPAPSKAADVLTAEQVSWGLGMSCGKSVHRLIDGGRMPGRRLPERETAKSPTRVVDRAALLRWMVEPLHWIYFKPERVGTMRPQGRRAIGDTYDFQFWEDARALVTKSRAAWDDAWLTPGQVARRLGMPQTRPVNRAIRTGTLRATRWGNWWIRQSDLPTAGMTINAYGRIVDAREIGRKHCPICREVGHNRRTCPARRSS